MQDLRDLVADKPYASLCSHVLQGEVSAVGGGSSCRTWSVEASSSQARTSKGVQVSGLEANAGPDQEDIDSDSVLLLRQIASQGPSRVLMRRCSQMLVHLGDPSSSGMGEVPALISYSFRPV